MPVRQVEFLTGAVQPGQYPPPDLPEVAFAGRSNVGKSSLLNRLLGRRDMARVSRTPGRTREINFFLVNGSMRLVDLPGYGFAQAPKGEKEKWDERMERYLVGRRNLRAVVLLLDIRRGITELDTLMMAYLRELGLPFLPVATKMDKVKGNERRNALSHLQKALDRPGLVLLAPPIPTSAQSGEGMRAIWEVVQGVSAGP